MIVKIKDDNEGYITTNQIEGVSKGKDQYNINRYTLVFDMVSGLKRTKVFDNEEKRDKMLLKVLNELDSSKGVLNEG